MPILRPGDIVIFDNLGSHKGKAVCRAIRDAGDKLFFLPPYSPDLQSSKSALWSTSHLSGTAADQFQSIVARDEQDTGQVMHGSGAGVGAAALGL